MNKEVFLELFSRGNRIREAAHYLLGMSSTPIDIICFMCFQSAETLLKSYLSLCNYPITRVHDLIYLVKVCAKYNIAFKQIEENCAELTSYNVLIYNDLSKEDAIDALNKVDSIYFIIRCVTNQLK
ncbi:HEPN domain-containing protein [Paenibacillus hodogayensis]|uniref:HEPN domain-containing protein n=1 Tax=Paenibacillus hodogayensis TaxID=279208 RepID=A0ABV5W741_9BACL